MAYINKDLSHARYNNFEPIPPGKYVAHISDSEERKSKKDDLYLSITWEILEGEYRGRKVFDSLMLTGSPRAVEIGDNKLRGMAEATGHPNPNFVQDTTELHGKPCLIKVKIEEGKGDYDDQNRVTSFAKLEGVSAPATPSPQAPAPSIPAHGTPPPQTPPPQPAPINQVAADIGYNSAAMQPGDHRQYPAAPAPQQAGAPPPYPPAGPPQFSSPPNTRGEAGALSNPAPGAKDAQPPEGQGAALPGGQAVDDMPWDDVPF